MRSAESRGNFELVSGGPFSGDAGRSQTPTTMPRIESRGLRLVTGLPKGPALLTLPDTAGQPVNIHMHATRNWCLPWFRTALPVVFGLVATSVAVKAVLHATGWANRLLLPKDGRLQLNGEHGRFQCHLQENDTTFKPDVCNTKWLVVLREDMNIRAEKDMASQILDTLPWCAIVEGKREGGWLKLPDERGFMKISLAGQAFLKKGSAMYEKIEYGQCADVGKFPIRDHKACEFAASAMGLADTSAEVTPVHDRPEGCYLLGRQELWFANSPANKGNGVKDTRLGFREPLCSSEEQPCVSTVVTTTTVTTLLCFTVARTRGRESKLLQAQFSKGVGMFSCDEYVVFSTGGTMQLGETWSIEIPSSSDDVGVSEQRAWDSIFMDGRFKHYAWVAKVLADTVFFPDRLRDYIRNLGGKARSELYIRNCRRGHRQNHSRGRLSRGPATLVSPVQVLTSSAVETYHDLVDSQCEDPLMQRCLDRLGVDSVDASDLFADMSCRWVSCWEKKIIAFHEFHNIQSWFDCWGRSRKGKH